MKIMAGERQMSHDFAHLWALEWQYRKTDKNEWKQLLDSVATSWGA